MSLYLLFDLDGTLVDTDHLHVGAFRALLAESGRTLSLDDYRAHIMGAANDTIGRFLFPDHPPEAHPAIMDRKEILVREAMGTLAPTTGLLDLLAWAQERAVPCAVVTNAPRANAELMLAAIGLSDRFSVVVIGDELPRAKPDPLPYLTALEKLGADVRDAVAFEDSTSGIRAASAAGIFTYGLRTALSDEALRTAGAGAIIDNFADASLRAHLEQEFSRDG